MSTQRSGRTLLSRSAKVIVAGAALVGCLTLGASVYLFALDARPSADPHGGALIFLPALILVVLGAAFLVVAFGVWRQSRGWQMLVGAAAVLLLLTVLTWLGVV